MFPWFLGENGHKFPKEQWLLKEYGPKTRFLKVNGFKLPLEMWLLREYGTKTWFLKANGPKVPTKTCLKQLGMFCFKHVSLKNLGPFALRNHVLGPYSPSNNGSCKSI